jgi:hypothetical protein
MRILLSVSIRGRYDPVRTPVAYVHQSWKDRDSHHNQKQTNSRPQSERYETV